MPTLITKTLITGMTMAALLTSGLPSFAQNLPTTPDNGERWNALEQPNDRLPQAQSQGQDYDAFSPTPVDQGSVAAYQADAVTIASLTADAAWAASDISRQHTFPGGVAALDALGAAIHSIDEVPSAKGEVLIRIAENHLRVIGDANGAAMLAAGARILSRDEIKPAVSYMRGMAQDLRKIGAVAAAQYLENAATLAEDGLGDARAGVLDAATLSMRFGAAPQPDLARILAYNPQEVTAPQVRNLMVALLNRIGAAIDDPQYAELAQSLERNATQEGVAYIRGRITAAQQDQARTPPPTGQGSQPSSASTILTPNRN